MRVRVRMRGALLRAVSLRDEPSACVYACGCAGARAVCVGVWVWRCGCDVGGVRVWCGVVWCVVWVWRVEVWVV